MTIQQFKQLNKTIKSLIKETESEALKEGVDISSSDFEQLVKVLKGRFLSAKGIALKEFESIEKRIKDDKELGKQDIKDSIKVLKLQRARDSHFKGQKKQFSKSVEGIKQELKEEVKDKVVQLAQKQTGEIEALKKRPAFKQENIKDLKFNQLKHNDFDHLGIIKDLNRFEQIFKEFQNSLVNINQTLAGKITQQDLENIKFDDKGLIENIKELKKGQKTINRRIEEAMAWVGSVSGKGSVSDKGGRFRAMMGQEGVRPFPGFRGYPDASWKEAPSDSRYQRKDHTVIGEAVTGTINGTNKIFTLANTPRSGTLKLFDGIRLNEGAGNDYTLSGQTITLVYAPETGANPPLADYEY